MKSAFALLWTAICLALVADCQTSKNLSVKVGGTITLICTTKDHEDQCRWLTPEGTSLAHDQNPEKRYIITFKSNVCTLNITKAIFNDTGVWNCRGQKLATLIVTAVPSQPYLQINDTKNDTDMKTMIPGSSVNLSCVSSHGHPKPIAMTWQVNGKIIERMEVANITVEEDGAITAITYLTLSMDQVAGYSLYNPDKEKKVTCTVEHVTKNTTVTKIFGNGYPTKKVELTPSSTVIKGSDIVQLSCDADGIPPPRSYSIINTSTNKTIGNEQNATTTTVGKYLCRALTYSGSFAYSKEVEITDGTNSGSALASTMWFSLCLTIVSILCITTENRSTL